MNKQTKLAHHWPYFLYRYNDVGPHALGRK